MFTFKNIIGNEKIIKNLQSAIINNKISHAYILDGQKGMGKKFIASAFAKTLQCEKGGMFSCDECISCKTFESGNNTDVIYVKPSKSKSISVDDIREQIGKNIELKPYKNRYKIFIVEKADTMTVQAQNSLLKTIEEPPSYGIFLLLSDNYNNFLPTILSRCVIFKLKPLELKLVNDFILNNFNVSDEDANIAALYSQGNIGKAIEIISSDEFISMRSFVIETFTELESKDLIGVYDTLNILEQYKENIQDVLDIVSFMYRDILAIKNIDNYDNFILQKDKLILLKNISENVSNRALYNRIDSVLDAKRQLKQNANFQMVMENMLLKLKEK